MIFKSQHISVSINSPASRVYEFASNPENLPKWAAGLSGSIKQVNGEWLADSPMGPVKITFAPQNSFGVLDHNVTLSSGEIFDNPMRVFANSTGSEVIFTLYQRPGMSDVQMFDDAKLIKKDLDTLRRLLEQ